MTPAINTAKQAKVPYQIHEYVHDAKAESYGEEAAEKLGLPLARVFKTLVVSLDGGELAVAVVPVSGLLDLKHCAAALGAKKCEMAARKDAERATGYVLGGISPLGQKKRAGTGGSGAPDRGGVRGSEPLAECGGGPRGFYGASRLAYVAALRTLSNLREKPRKRD